MLSVALRKRLEGFTLDIAWTGTERVVALLGPPGSGKTVTLHCLAGLLRPDQGRIELDRTVLFDGESGIDVPTRARRLGYVLQGYALFPHLTVEQNVAYGLHAWPRARRAERVAEVLERLGLSPLALRHPRELSGGQQQRVALGRALAPDPAILLLDEPLSALDAPLRRQLRAELVATLREWDTTTVLVTHDLSEAYELADQIVVYERGRVLQSSARRDSVRRPSSEAVARIMGLRNILRGTVLRAAPERIALQWRGQTLEAANAPDSPYAPPLGTEVVFIVRPELIRLIRKDGPGPDKCRHRNLLDAAIVRESDLGTERVLAVRLDAPGTPAQGDADLEIEVSPLVHEILGVERHRQWQLAIQPAAIHVLPAAEPAPGDSSPTATGLPGHEDSLALGQSLERRAPLPAAVAGAGVGVLGGLLGLGGAEFRLPLLVGYFRYPLRRAVSLNLAVSLLTVVAAAVTRLVFSDQALDSAAGPIAVAMMLGGMGGAALASRWLARVSENRLQQAVRTLLIGIGVLLIVESVTGWTSTGLSLGMASKAAIGLVAGLLIGIVSTLLGVAGGELIIPTLALVFGVPVKVAGTLSLLISVPTILVGLDRHRARGAFRGVSDVRHLIVPMGLGTIVGGIAGGLLVAYVPAGAVKVLLGVVLIASALKVFAVHRGVRQGASLSS